MFDRTSRYNGNPIATYVARDGRGILYVTRRMLPMPATMSIAGYHTVRSEERLDVTTASFYGDPTQFWRICDANAVLDPRSLEQSGERIAIPSSAQNGTGLPGANSGR